MSWFNDHGAKVLTGLVTILAAVNEVDPDAANALMGGAGGKRWWALGLGVAALLHTTLLNPAPKPVLPPPQAGGNSSGRARVGFLVTLAAAGAAVVWMVYDSAHQAAAVAPGGPFAGSAIAGEP